MLKTIICDFDGVWVDSFDVLYRINEVAVAKIGLQLTPEQYRAAFNGPIHHELRKLLGLDEARQLEFSNYKRQIFSSYYHSQSVRFFPFAGPLIAELSRLGRLHIVTASPPEAVSKLLEQQRLRDYFGDVLGFSLVGKRAALDRLVGEASHSESFFITDTVGDIREAAGLKLKVVAVAWGFHQRSDLQAAGAHAVVSDGDGLKICLQDAAAVDN